MSHRPGHWRRWSRAAATTSVLALGAAQPAYAGPPFLTDDPEPTETGHWEIYAPAFNASGKGPDYEGSMGAELNYGAGPNLQVTVGLPISFAHSSEGYETGRGDLALSIKYRFFQNDAERVSVAAFPGITLPTASHGLGGGKVTALLPVWGQKDFGPWSLFGGGGYAINPGARRRDYWTGGVALNRQVSDRLVLGVEANRRGPDSDDGRAATSVGLAAILKLKAPLSLLGSVGPTYLDGGGTPGFHAFAALGVNF